MGPLLSHTHLHVENNSPQSAFYTDQLKYYTERDMAYSWKCKTIVFEIHTREIRNPTPTLRGALSNSSI